ncbi:hypothetical protein HZA99_05550 [Candidatus Woesearchaeota archaeon]|nr:hypothetical protein [Candidatus Woesearchaeota archaeon]
MRAKRSQITVFIVLGIVIFTIIGLLFYLKTYVKSKQFTEEQQKTTDVFNVQGKYSTYMQSCLDQTAKQAVALVGMQGGVIYDYEANGTKPFLGPKKYRYGQYALPFELPKELNAYDGKEEIINVSYGIFAPDLSLNIEGHPSVPDYPYGITKLIEEPSDIDSIYTQSFGNVLINPLPPLCDYFGPNSPAQEGAVFSCETYDSKRKADNDNIQEYLQAYITNAWKECISLDSLPEFKNSTMRTGNVTVKVTFAPTSVAVDGIYPIVGEISGKETTLSFEQFHSTVNVRLQQIHELAERMIKADTNNIFFNIVRDANELDDCKELGKETKVVTCLKEDMQITKYRDVCQADCKKYGKFDDIVLIQDNASPINGKPFVFAFAMQNRYPALDYIAPMRVTVPNPVSFEDKDVKGYDPDEDDHNEYDFMDNRYIYGQWKVDYDELPDGTKINVGEVKNGFVVNGRTAIYSPTTPEDVGTHIVQIQICDNEGLCDFQNVEVTVEPESP